MKTQHTPGSRPGSELNWLVVNSDGHLLAMLDSESEAHFFTKNRGHAADAVYFKAPCDYAAAPELLEALEAFCEDHTKPCGCANCAIIAKAKGTP